MPHCVQVEMMEMCERLARVARALGREAQVAPVLAALSTG